MENTASPPQPAQAPPRTSRLAVWSLVLGVLFIIPPLGVAAFVLGIIALTEISKSGGALTGKGMAIAGVVLGALELTLPCCAIQTAVLLPAVSRARAQARVIQGKHNLDQIAAAMAIYKSDYNDEFPLDLQSLAQARVVQCKHNLDQIAAAMVIYKSDYNDEFPLDLQSLVDGDYVKDPRVFVCPDQEAPIDASNVDATSAYCYARVTGQRNPGSLPAPIMWDIYPHRDGIVVLFEDLHRDCVTPAAFASALEANSPRYTMPPRLPAEEWHNQSGED